MGLKDRITEYFNIGELKDNLVRLVEAKFELKKIELQEKLEGLVAGFVVKLASLLILFGIIIFVNILLASLVNQWLGSFWIGYAVMLGIYVLTYLLLSYKKDRAEDIIIRIIRKEIEKREL